MIEETLRSVYGDKSLAASLLGITARTIYRREAEWAGDGRAVADEGEGSP
jgi:transcriptional regulator with PAS, ATPase and Fis domain